MADRTTYQDRIDSATAVIADGQSLSGAIAVGGMLPVGVLAPAANWTTAAISFQGSLDGVTYIDVYDDAGEYSTGSLANGQGCSINREVFRMWRYLKVRSGTAGAPVAQAGGDTVTLILEAR